MTTETPQLQEIRVLHAIYCEITGNTLALTQDRISMWFYWLEYGRHVEQDWGQTQLRAVVKYLREQIGRDTRRPASLLFRNLIERPADFEEDLLLARQAYKRRQKRPGEGQPVQQITPTAEGLIVRQLQGAEVPRPTSEARQVGAAGVEEFRRLKLRLNAPQAEEGQP